MNIREEFVNPNLEFTVLGAYRSIIAIYDIAGADLITGKFHFPVIISWSIFAILNYYL